MLEWWQIVLLAMCGMAAGFIDSIAGGGGLLTLPALLWAGLPPVTALGTNKMQSCFGTLLAVRRFARAGLLDARELRVGVLVTFVSSVAGTCVVAWWLSPDLLRKGVPWLLIGLAVFLVFSPRLGLRESRPRISATLFALGAGSVLGFYDGFFGPGTGSFWMLACVALLGSEIRRATAYTKVMNLTSNLGSLLVFAVAGAVMPQVALPMIAGQMIGGWLGAGMVVRDGARIIRPVLITGVLAMAAKLLWDGSQA